MKSIIEDFFAAFFSKDLAAVFTKNTPQKMMASGVDKDGWFTWMPIDGTLTYKDYQKVEDKFKVVIPKSFIEWHKTYFFLKGDCSIIRLSTSSPTQPLEHLCNELDYDMAEDLIGAGLYPFGQDGGDRGPLVFDARYEVKDNEFPIRFFDYGYGLEGLSEIIFSSFPKLLECLTHFLRDTRPGGYEAIYDFLAIDPEGAGKTGMDYWLEWADGIKLNYEQED